MKYNSTIKMTDLQLLGLKADSDKTKIRQALVDRISDLDFEIDIERIFSYILCSQRLIQQLDKRFDILKSDDLDSEEMADDLLQNLYSPESLVAHFTTLYQNPNLRFNIWHWQSALEAIETKDASYCKPIVDFLNTNPFLKSEVLKLIANAFPFETFFPSAKEKGEYDAEFWKQNGFVYGLLRNGNSEFDLYADTLNTGQFTVVQLDDLYNRLLGSTRFYRNRQYAQAFNVLSDGIPAHVKPLLIWQRELNILYKAAFVEKEENLNELFANTLNLALTSFPDDEQLIYLRCKFLFLQYSPEEFREEIVATLRLLPDHPKTLFLLGKCYMQLGISRAALIIFENLKKLHPLNMEYVTATALASRAYIDFCIREHDPKDNSRTYYIRMISELIERTMFDEVSVFAAEAPTNDPDIAALLLYAKEVETYSQNGQKDNEALFDALLLAKDTEIRRKIKTHYLADLATWADVLAEKKFILDFYAEYSTDAMANYQMGMLHFAEDDFAKACHYFLTAQKIDPSNTVIYYNLARAMASANRLEEAIEYINSYLLYNKYHLKSNELHCAWNYTLKKFDIAHSTAKWILSICRIDEFQPEHFFYFNASLSRFLDTIENERHNLAYIAESLKLYDLYSKPATFWTDEHGPKSMYFAAKLCYNMRDYKQCVKYSKAVLQNTKEHKSISFQLCQFELLPQSLYELNKHAELIKLVEGPTQALLAESTYVYRAAEPALFLGYAFGALKKPAKQMDWVLKCAYCYMQTEKPPIDWLTSYLANNFQTCLNLELAEEAISLGKAYLDILATPTHDHIWVAHNVAVVYASNGNQEEALKYHHFCTEYRTIFPEIYSSEEYEGYADLINESQQFVDTYQTKK